MWLLCLLVLLCSITVHGLDIHVSNLNESCVQCICSLYGCERSRGCDEGYCGPFYLSRVYWADAGKPTIADDEPTRSGENYLTYIAYLLSEIMTLCSKDEENINLTPIDVLSKTKITNESILPQNSLCYSKSLTAFNDCARDYNCSVRTIRNYMGIHGKDCNRDGVTDCFDFVMINYNGGNDCSSPLYKSVHGRQLLTGFQKCRL